ncbi:hypothetical protein Leryth_021208, partial [Lithospermum erythrorhizon]
MKCYIIKKCLIVVTSVSPILIIKSVTSRVLPKTIFLLV